jgi:glycosyltransferase involved in cell wall biosynthesis
MKKILIITDIQHAAPRIPGIIKYLSRYGYDPILVSPSPPQEIQYFGGQRISLPAWASTVAQRGYLLYCSFFHFPDEMKHQFEGLLSEARHILRYEKIHAIVSSSSPVSSHIVARELKLEFGIPWVADLRDLWSQNHNYQYGPFRMWRDTSLEMKTLGDADALVTVSEPLARKLRTRYKRKPVVTITNGFDPETQIPSSLSKRFTITYTGQIYPRKQDIGIFRQALDELIRSNTFQDEDLDFRLFGPQGILIPKKEAIARQRDSQILLLLNWLENEGVYTLKIFEYLAAGRPILAVGGKGGDVIEELLRKTNAGVYAKTVGDVKKSLVFFYSEFKEKGVVTYQGIPEEIQKYSYIEIARQFAAVIGQKEIPEK